MLIYFLKTIFGSLEVFGVLLISTAIFRSTYGSFMKELLYISVLVSIVQTLEYDILQTHFIMNELTVILMIFFLTKLFLKTTWWHSAILSLTGYISGIFIQGILVFIFNSLELIGIQDAMYTPIATCLVQSVEFLTLLFLSKSLRKSRYGFVFVYDKMNYHSKFKTPTILMFLFSISLIFLEFISMYFSIKDIVHWDFILATSTILLLLTFGSIYFRSTQELEDYHSKLYIPNIFK